MTEQRPERVDADARDESGGTETSPSPATSIPLTLSANDAAALLGIGKTTFWSLHNQGKLPKPVRLGRRVLWRRKELEAWLEADCPSRDRWEAMSTK